jgi:hypothetical protein
MTSARGDVKPAVVLDHPNGIANFHGQLYFTDS